MIDRLCESGYFYSRRYKETKDNTQFADILIATAFCSVATALFLTPLDMVIFKLPFIRPINQAPSLTTPSLLQVARTTFNNRPGGLTALSFACAGTFIRHFFSTASIQSYLNFYGRSDSSLL